MLYDIIYVNLNASCMIAGKCDDDKKRKIYCLKIGRKPTKFITALIILLF